MKRVYLCPWECRRLFSWAQWVSHLHQVPGERPDFNIRSPSRTPLIPQSISRSGSIYTPRIGQAPMTAAVFFSFLCFFSLSSNRLTSKRVVGCFIWLLPQAQDPNRLIPARVLPPSPQGWLARVGSICPGTCPCAISSFLFLIDSSSLEANGMVVFSSIISASIAPASSNFIKNSSIKPL